MRMSLRLCALATVFGLFSAGTVGAAAFLPLEQFGHSQAISLPADRSFHSNRAI
jgi:hypothetical protein